MEYERIILELLERICQLEERVERLEKRAEEPVAEGEMNALQCGKKYRTLKSYLEQSGGQKVELSFREVEEILRFKLPESAFRHREFWSNTASHPIAVSWLSAGYETVRVDMGKEQIVLERKS